MLVLSCFQPPSGHGDAGCRWDLTSLFSTFTHSDRMVVGKSEHLEPASMGDSYLKTLCKDCRQCFYWHHGHPLTYSFSAISLIAECERAHVHIGKKSAEPCVSWIHPVCRRPGFVLSSTHSQDGISLSLSQTAQSLNIFALEFLPFLFLISFFDLCPPIGFFLQWPELLPSTFCSRHDYPAR